MTQASTCPTVPVSWGELLDKITILRIKRERIADKARVDADKARANVERELACLLEPAAAVIGLDPVTGLVARLQAVNEALWAIEDAIREREAEADFGAEFIALARAVYTQNDRRAAIKREINDVLGSELVEEKSYAGGVAPAGL